MYTPLISLITLRLWWTSLWDESGMDIGGKTFCPSENKPNLSLYMYLIALDFVHDKDLLYTNYDTWRHLKWNGRFLLSQTFSLTNDWPLPLDTSDLSEMNTWHTSNEVSCKHIHSMVSVQTGTDWSLLKLPQSVCTHSSDLYGAVCQHGYG